MSLAAILLIATGLTGMPPSPSGGRAAPSWDAGGRARGLPGRSWDSPGRPAGAPGTFVEAGASAHDFHVVYGRMGIEGSVIQVRLRFFADDLTEGIRRHAGEPDFTLGVDPHADSLVTAYVNHRFRVTARSSSGPELLGGVIATSGEEQDGAEPVWWYVFSYQARATIVGVDVSDSLLTELFDDQRNILRIQHFPSEKQQTYYLSHGDADARFDV